ncbi:MAG: glycogen synthase GlgA [Planctomycetaceae bacterium]|jgi:starch synthase|nr:glycogen synthase GlgA [Planctomycetaceae bacterium]
MKILFVSSEVAPFAKTGGLADVSASLPVALKDVKHNVTIITPFYKCTPNCGEPIEETGLKFTVPVGGEFIEATLLKSKTVDGEIPIYFIKQDRYFDRNGLYSENGVDYNDNCERFVFFCRAVMESIDVLNLDIDILHTNDWQTGLIPAYLSILYRERSRYEKISTIHSIHNLAYQGIFWHWDMPLTGIGWEHFTFDEMEFYGKLNLMKTGIMFAKGVTTVSPRYAIEIQSPEFGCGMESVLQYRSPMLRGILNGVSTRQWNPKTDRFIVAQYDHNSITENKPKCKKNLQERLGLAVNEESPLIGLVGRLAYQKGIDLIADVIPLWVEKHNVQFCMLGMGDPALEKRLISLAEKYPKNVATKIEFSDEWSHLIEAGADIFLMPSRYEPCGLNQMYSQIYGTIPIVRYTGGLADTVVDTNDETLENGTATGFTLVEDNLNDLNTTIWRTLNTFWNKKDVWQKIIQNAMRQDWSWRRSAEQYTIFYDKFHK